MVVVLTVKLPAALDAELQDRAARTHLSKSELVRRALQAYLQQSAAALTKASAFDHVADLVGSCHGGPADLSSNPNHLAGFGSL
jgi:Arc/MetJ-type ribon-helix-helix transcriptional regulator